MDLKYAFEKISDNEEMEAKLKKMRLISLVSFLNDNEEIESWEFNYYDDKKDKINRYIIDRNNVYYNEELKPVKIDKSNNHIDVNNLNMDVDDVLDMAWKEKEEKYGKEEVQKVFLSLSFDENNRLVWTISLITNSIGMIIISIEDESKEIKSKFKRLF